MLILFILFGLLNAALWYRCKETGGMDMMMISTTPEFYMATVGLGSIALMLRFYGIEAIALELRYYGLDAILCIRNNNNNNKKTLRKSTLFTRSFLLLSLCEVIFTIVAPWVILLLPDNKGDKEQQQQQQQQQHHLAMIAHLFAFQAQIAWEACLTGQGRDMEMLLYTVVANTYRGWILFQTSTSATSSSSVDLTIWRLTLALWCFSSFIFMPLIWYPCLETTVVHDDVKAKLTSTKATKTIKVHSS